MKERRYTNNYLCAKDDTRWDAESSCICTDRCPNCDSETEPYASTRYNDTEEEIIHNQEVYKRANVL